MDRWSTLQRLLEHPDCQGAGPIQILAGSPFWEEDELPFLIGGGGTVLHVLPDEGFLKESLAGSEDERLLIADCPDEPGWLVPDDIVADWMNRNISCPDLEDLILTHPLYEYLTAPDEDGHSRGGHRGELVQWAPGLPTLASVYAPEFLPDDDDAPPVNRQRVAYAAAVADLARQLEAAFDAMEIEVGVRFGNGNTADDSPDAWRKGQLAA
ncbi:MAG: hypothetical protein ACPHID_06825 [Thermoplasmatota archaeon]